MTHSIKCTKCRTDAVIFQRYSGMHLCEEHFVSDFEARVKKAIRKHRWIESGDRIAVAFSGGKDSSALLYFLKKTFGMRRDLEIFAITIDEGIAGYRILKDSKKFADQMGIDWHTSSFAEEYAITMDEIVRRKGDTRSCSFCGVLRRRLLYKTARELGATKIAFGFNLDDEAQSVLMNVLRGDVNSLTRRQVKREMMVPRIRPFINLPEREVALYSRLHVQVREDSGCPYSHNALRGDVRTHLNEYSYWHPQTKFALVNLGEELSAMGNTVKKEMSICGRCSEPCMDVCRTCQILDEVRRDD